MDSRTDSIIDRQSTDSETAKNHAKKNTDEYKCSDRSRES